MAQPCPARGGHNCPLKLGRTSPLLLQGCGFAMAAGCSPGAFRAACGAPKRVAEFLAELCCQDLPSPWPPPCTQAPEEPVWALWAEWPPPPHTQPCGEATKGRTGREVPSSVGTRVPCCCCCTQVSELEAPQAGERTERPEISPYGARSDTEVLCHLTGKITATAWR